ncbi:Gfo/Idh/MocA family protein [Streptacidiphilus sp. N1-12]|uniref:Gfo/Idh/MocA family protein n=2 Tax=Streptacidiphilus alkalitolerans TaxID=3342712 RepID=A0ABV6WFQ8_9ACTN
MTDIRLGLIGAGAVGVLHAEAAHRAPGVRVAAVCDLLPATAQAVASSWQAACFTDHRALLASGLVDAVVVNTPHALHRDIVLDCAAAGVHILCEKPMATTVEDCLAMARACAEAGVVLFIGHIQHFLPPMAAARTALDDGAIGPLLMVDDRRSTDYRPGTRPSWFFDPAVSGGGVFMNIGTHCVDRLLWLTGAQVRTVSASAAHRETHPVETDVLARLELTGGLVGHIAVTSAGLPYHDELVLIGERGAIKVSRGTGASLHPYTGPGAGTPVLLAAEAATDVPEAFRRQLLDFAAAVRGERAPSVTADHGLRVIEVVTAVYRSCATGRPTRFGAGPVPAPGPDPGPDPGPNPDPDPEPEADPDLELVPRSAS